MHNPIQTHPTAMVDEGAVIGAGSVATKNIPPYALIAGNTGEQAGWVDRDGTSVNWQPSS